MGCHLVDCRMITPELIQAIRKGYALPWRGIHGVVHWARVLENGLRLAEVTGASPDVVSLFAVFHDARRINEHWDRDHGRRGAEFARSLRGSAFDLSDEEFDLLHFACTRHTDGLTEGDITVQTCWDADRLDLGRAGIEPRPDLLCTAAAKGDQMLEWAYQRSVIGHEPEFIEREWRAADT
jgi:uncharacterized protein